MPRLHGGPRRPSGLPKPTTGELPTCGPASGALDKEHEHRNLPTRGSHIKTDDLSRDVLPQPMTTLTDEQRRALRLLARSPNHGCPEAILLAHGFESAMQAKLVLDGLAKVEVHDTKVAGRRVKVKVTWLRITEAGRKAIAERKAPPLSGGAKSRFAVRVSARDLEIFRRGLASTRTRLSALHSGPADRPFRRPRCERRRPCRRPAAE
jgi:hypothetical protein